MTSYVSSPVPARLRAACAAVFLVAALSTLIGLPNRAEAAMRIQRVDSPGGIEAWLVEEHAIPMLAIDIGFRGGSSLDPKGKSGLGEMFAGMLEEGAGDLDASAYARRAEDLALRADFDSGRDALTVSARMLTRNRDASVELLRLALNAPRFDPEPLERVRGQMISGIRQAGTDPNSIASDAFMAALFPGDAYGRPARGGLKSVAGLTAADLRAAAPRLLKRTGMKIGVVGDITAEELGPLLDRLLGDLPATAAPQITDLTPAEISGVKVIKQDIPQSVAIFGHAGIKRDDPDYIPAYVMNYILGGGGFSSRLTEEVRAKKGLAYSVYSYLSPMDRSGLYVGGVSTANARMGESIKLIRAEWRRMAQGGVTQEELDKAKRYLTGAFPLRFDSNAKIAGYLMGAQMAKLGIDYIDTRNDLVNAVSIKDVARIAKRLLHEDALFFVVVGDPQGIEAAD